MADFFGKQSYPAVVTSHFFYASQGGTLGLMVTAEVTNAKGETQEVKGTFWFTKKTKKGKPGTMVSPGNHADGTPKRSRAERALNALGYKGALSDMMEITEEDGGISLVGNQFLAALEMDTYQNRNELKIAFFNDVSSRVSKESVGNAVADLLGVTSKVGSPSPIPFAGMHRPEDDPPPPLDEVPF